MNYVVSTCKVDFYLDVPVKKILTMHFSQIPYFHKNEIINLSALILDYEKEKLKEISGVIEVTGFFRVVNVEQRFTKEYVNSILQPCSHEIAVSVVPIEVDNPLYNLEK